MVLKLYHLCYPLLLIAFAFNFRSFVKAEKLIPLILAQKIEQNNKKKLANRGKNSIIIKSFLAKKR